MQEKPARKVATIKSILYDLDATLGPFLRSLADIFLASFIKFVGDIFLLGSVDTRFHADTAINAITLHFSVDGVSEEDGAFTEL